MRVSVVGLFVLMVALATVSCRSGGGDRLPKVAHVYADGGLAAQVQSIAGEFLAPHGITVEASPNAAGADLAVTAFSTEKDAQSFVARYWVPVVSPPSSLRELTMNQLSGMVSGAITDWSSVDGRPAPVRVLLPAGDSPPFVQWIQALSTSFEALPAAEIPAALDADHGALALLPLDAVDASVRSLAIDGVNIVFGTGDLSSYALRERVYVRRGDVHGDLKTILDQLGVELGARLGVKQPDPIIMRMTGDIIPARCVYTKQRDYGDYRHAFLKLGPWLSQADITAGSLDAALSDTGRPMECVDTFSLMGPAASVEGLAYSGFDVITNAANHAKDCGQAACGDQALFDTIANLGARGIQVVGSGPDLAAARQPVFLMSKGIRFAFLGYDDIAPYYHAEPGVAGTAPLDEAYVREDVASAAQQADVVIVMPHWGIEYQAEPTERQRTIAAAAVAAGATMVLGNHPHWVEANEMIGHSFVEYALGNFAFDQDWSLETQQGAVLEVAFQGKALKGIEYYPVHIWDQNQPDFAGPAEAQQILGRIWNASATLR